MDAGVPLPALPLRASLASPRSQPVATPSPWPLFPPSRGACATNLISNSICPTRKPLATISINCPDSMADFDYISHIYRSLYGFCPPPDALRNSGQSKRGFLSFSYGERKPNGLALAAAVLNCRSCRCTLLGQDASDRF